MTEKEKARAGLLYNNNFDPELIRERTECQKKCQAYNALPVDAAARRKAALREILHVSPPEDEKAQDGR